MSLHMFWSGCGYEHGDLRAREGLCSCSQCMNGHYYDCAMMAIEDEEVSGVLAWLLHRWR